MTDVIPVTIVHLSDDSTPKIASHIDTKLSSILAPEYTYHPVLRIEWMRLYDYLFTISENEHLDPTAEEMQSFRLFKLWTIGALTPDITRRVYVDRLSAKLTLSGAPIAPITLRQLYDENYDFSTAYERLSWYQLSMDGM